jgi:deoxycytidylate deaminase
MLINAGINKIYYKEGYEDGLSREMLRAAGIEVEQLSKEMD